MGKVLLGSDFHLKNYSRYNRFPGQRLESFIQLAEDIGDIGEKYQVDTFIGAGDLVDAPFLSPKEVHAYFRMMGVFSKRFKYSYWIVGNHDMALKTDDFASNDTIITLAEMYPNVKFIHRNVLTLPEEQGFPKDFTVAMENWVPKHDLKWLDDLNLPDIPDMYVSHAAIDYLETGLYGMDTSVFEGKFKEGYFGDIHVHGSLGNLHSIGNTKQESLNDRFEGGVMLVTVDPVTRVQSRERILIDPEGKKYLKLVKTEVESLEGWEDPIVEGKDPREFSSLKYYVYKPVLTKTEAKVYEAITSELVAERLIEAIENAGLQSIHQEVSADLNYEAIDFQFKVLYFEAHNYRSIDKIRLVGNTSYIFKGANGTGKSSVMRGWKELWTGRNPKNSIRRGQTEMFLGGGIEYQGSVYELEKTANGAVFKIDSEVQKYNNINALYKDVLEKLPFLAFHESFLFDSTDIRLLGRVKVDRRFELLSRYYKLDYLDGFFNNAANLLTIEVNKNQSKLQERSTLKTKIETNETLIESAKTSMLDILNSLNLGLTDVAGVNHYLGILQKIKDLRIQEGVLEAELSKASIQVQANETLIIKYDMDFHPFLSRDLNAERAVLDAEEASLRNASSTLYHISTLRNAISVKETEIVKYQESLESQKTEITTLETELVNTSNQLGEDPQAQISVLKASSEEITKSITDAVSALNSRSAVLGKEKELVETLEAKLNSDKTEVNDNPICGACNRPMDHTLKLQVIAKEESELNARKAKLVDDLNSLNAEVTEFNSGKYVEDSKKIQEINSQIEGIQSLVNKVSSIQEQINFRKSALVKSGETITRYQSEISETQTMISGFEAGIPQEFSGKTVEELNVELTGVITRSANWNTDVLTHNKILDDKAVAQAEVDSGKVALKTTQDSLDLIKSEVAQYASYRTDASVEAELNRYKYLHDSVEPIEKVQKESSERLQELEVELQQVEKRIKDLEEYKSITSKSGIVIKEVLDKLTKKFTNEQFKFSTVKELKNGNIKPDMTLHFNVDGVWMPYEDCSDGQMTLCDLYFIHCITTGVGLIYMDETLKFLDENNTHYATELLSTLKVNTIWLSSHLNNIRLDNSGEITCSRVDGVSHYDINLV